MKRALAAEFLGTLLLVATVVGSGIMAEQLAGENAAVALLGNTAATAGTLFVLISIFGPVSGAQFNPAVTLVFGRRRADVIAVQLAGAMVGTLLAHAMFGLALLQPSAKVRATPGEWLGEAVATFGLVLTIRLGQRYRADALPALVAAWIVAGYWFTSSTSFANPAVAVARSLTDTFSGIRPIDVPAFVVAQLAGAALGGRVGAWFIAEEPA